MNIRQTLEILQDKDSFPSEDSHSDAKWRWFKRNKQNLIFLINKTNMEMTADLIGISLFSLGRWYATQVKKSKECRQMSEIKLRDEMAAQRRKENLNRRFEDIILVDGLHNRSLQLASKWGVSISQARKWRRKYKHELEEFKKVI